MVLDLDLLREGIRQAREPAHGHADRQVLAFHERRADVLRVRVSKDSYPLRTRADRRTVPFLALGFIAIVLHELGIIDLIGEGVDNGIQVELEAVADMIWGEVSGGSRIEVLPPRTGTRPNLPRMGGGGKHESARAPLRGANTVRVFCGPVAQSG